jgi:DNA-binding beta-propeller fold protein YncE
MTGPAPRPTSIAAAGGQGRSGRACGTGGLIGQNGINGLTIPVGSAPQGVAVSPVGPAAGDVFVTNTSSATVSVISF